MILKEYRPNNPPCSTCAFAPRTDDWEGFEATVWGLMQAVTQDRPFYCHRNMETVDGEYKLDVENMVPCGGYEAIRHLPETKRALMDAACAVKEND